MKKTVMMTTAKKRKIPRKSQNLQRKQKLKRKAEKTLAMITMTMMMTTKSQQKRNARKGYLNLS